MGAVRRTIRCAACALVLLLAQQASTTPPHALAASLLESKLLWATVDVCNAPADPGVVGIRASMPGTGDAAERMYMRFRLQYRGTGGVWRYVGASGDSGFIYVGDALFVSRQAGSNFQLATSSNGASTLRGLVIFEWRLDGRTIHHAQLTTTAKHSVTQGSVPRGYSASRCTIG